LDKCSPTPEDFAIGFTPPFFPFRPDRLEALSHSILRSMHSNRSESLCAVRIFSFPPMNFARQKTCKTLLQVKQSFVIHLKTLTPQPRCGFALRKPAVLRVFPPDEFRYGTV